MNQNSNLKQSIIIGALAGALVLSIGVSVLLYFQNKNQPQSITKTKLVEESKISQTTSDAIALHQIEEKQKTPNILTEEEQAEVFKAVNAVQREGNWVIERDDKQSTAGVVTIEKLADLNGDGRKEALVIDDGGSYYGNTGQQFTLLSKQTDGGWRIVIQEIAIPKFLESHGVDGWPDIELGGPGFSHPVVRWNGKEYAQHSTTEE